MAKEKFKLFDEGRVISDTTMLIGIVIFLIGIVLISTGNEIGVNIGIIGGLLAGLSAVGW